MAFSDTVAALNSLLLGGTQRHANASYKLIADLLIHNPPINADRQI
jgi:hypothetical protein